MPHNKKNVVKIKSKRHDEHDEEEVEKVSHRRAVAGGEAYARQVSKERPDVHSPERGPVADEDQEPDRDDANSPATGPEDEESFDNKEDLDTIRQRKMKEERKENEKRGDSKEPETVKLAGKATKGSYRKVVMLRTVSPAPRVGTVDLRKAENIRELQQGRTYNVPAVVADVLIDSGSASEAK